MPTPPPPGRLYLKRCRRRVLEWLAIHVFGRMLLPMLTRTWRVEVDIAPELLARARAGERVILAFWHNRQLGLVPIASLVQPVSVLVSRHRDGEMIARIVERLGVGAVRGSSTRGGAAALRQMVAATRKTSVAITPDGPLGPRYQAKEGVVALAARSGCPVYWVCWSTDRAWIFGSWDRFILPKPFARIRYQAEGPMQLAPDASPAELEEARTRLEDQMRAQAARLDTAMGLDADR